jgi:hypothetical protein
MDPGLFDVLHHPAHQRPAAVFATLGRSRSRSLGAREIGDHVHVALDRLGEELVDQDRLVGQVAGAHRQSHVEPQLHVVEHGFHRPAAQDEARPHQHRVPDAVGHLDRLVDVVRDPVPGLADVQLLQQRREPLPVFR